MVSSLGGFGGLAVDFTLASSYAIRAVGLHFFSVFCNWIKHLIADYGDNMQFIVPPGARQAGEKCLPGVGLPLRAGLGQNVTAPCGYEMDFCTGGKDCQIKSCITRKKDL